MRPLFLPRPRTFQRTSYRPGALCQFDLWQPSREIPVGAGQTRRGYVVVGCLPYSRAGAGALMFSKKAPDLLYGIGECLLKLGGLPEILVWDREGALHAGGGRPWSAAASSCASPNVRWSQLRSTRASWPAGMPARSPSPHDHHRADPGMTAQAELAHLFRTLKAPAAARALPKLAERARQEEWSYERFAEALLATEVASSDSHGGESRIKQARFPARKTLEEFDFSFQRSVQKTLVLHLGQLDFLTAKRQRRSLGPARHR